LIEELVSCDDDDDDGAAMETEEDWEKQQDDGAAAGGGGGGGDGDEEELVKATESMQISGDNKDDAMHVVVDEASEEQSEATKEGDPREHLNLVFIGHVDSIRFDSIQLYQVTSSSSMSTNVPSRSTNARPRI